MKLELTPRLALLASWVPPGARLIDVGTDHGYLPAWLIQNGRIEEALASDLRFGIDMGVIPEGPLAYEAIMTVVEPAYLQLKAGTELNGEELEHQRAEAVQQVLSAYRRK